MKYLPINATISIIQLFYIEHAIRSKKRTSNATYADKREVITRIKIMRKSLMKIVIPPSPLQNKIKIVKFPELQVIVDAPKNKPLNEISRSFLKWPQRPNKYRIPSYVIPVPVGQNESLLAQNAIFSPPQRFLTSD